MHNENLEYIDFLQFKISKIFYINLTLFLIKKEKIYF